MHHNEVHNYVGGTYHLINLLINPFVHIKLSIFSFPCNKVGTNQYSLELVSEVVGAGIVREPFSSLQP